MSSDRITLTTHGGPITVPAGAIILMTTEATTARAMVRGEVGTLMVGGSPITVLKV